VFHIINLFLRNESACSSFEEDMQNSTLRFILRTLAQVNAGLARGRGHQELTPCFFSQPSSTLDQGFCRPIRGDWIRVTMHNLPDSLFYPKNSSHPQSYRGGILPSANLDPRPLILDNEGKFRGATVTKFSK
jgi:hypothetical protein